MAIELVIFDLAGTTVDDRGAVNRCLRAALSASGREVSSEQVDTVMGIPKPIAIKTLIGDEATDEDAHHIHADFVERMIAYYQLDPSVGEMPGTSEVFRELGKMGIKRAVDTGFSRDIVTVLLDRLGWERDGLIDASITSDEVERGRPHPDMIRALMARLGVADPSSVAKVGDTPSDLEEGSNAGCALVVGTTAGTHNREQLESCPHTHVVDSLDHLIEIFKQANQPDQHD